jgi:hypothetical protein
MKRAAKKNPKVTRDDLHQMKADIVEEVRKETHKVLVSNDKVVTRLDRLLKEDAAHTERHRRIDDRVDTHEERIKRIERVRG